MCVATAILSMNIIGRKPSSIFTNLIVHGYCIVNSRSNSDWSTWLYSFLWNPMNSTHHLIFAPMRLENQNQTSRDISCLSPHGISVSPIRSLSMHRHSRYSHDHEHTSIIAVDLARGNCHNNLSWRRELSDTPSVQLADGWIHGRSWKHTAKTRKFCLSELHWVHAVSRLWPLIIR